MSQDSIRPNTPTPKTPCDLCGACCQTFQILVSKADADREPRIKSEGLELPEWAQSKEYRFKLHPLPFQKSCCFLGESNLCKIYETRPEVCRKFEAGTKECEVARLAIGLDPLPIQS